jgi:hypothetical protein
VATSDVQILKTLRRTYKEEFLTTFKPAAHISIVDGDSAKIKIIFYTIRERTRAELPNSDEQLNAAKKYRQHVLVLLFLLYFLAPVAC